MILLLAVLVACDPAGGLEGACDDVCPEGTRSISNASLSVAYEGTLALYEEGCEAFCEPLAPCIAPNVPVVEDGDPDVYRCEGIDGFSQIPPLDEVDTSFGLLWDGGALPAITSDLPTRAPHLVAADVDGDGRDDLIGLTPDWELFTSLSVGDGTFADPIHTALPSSSVGFAAGDLTGDGVVDVVWARASGAIELSPGRPDGGFEPSSTLATAAPATGAAPRVTLADLDGDGRLDLVVDDWTSDGGAAVFFAASTPLVGGPVEVPLGATPTANGETVLLDADGDADLDVFLTTAGGHLLTLDAGSFTVSSLTGLDHLSYLQAGGVDADGDGAEDLVYSDDTACAGSACLASRLGPDLSVVGPVFEDIGAASGFVRLDGDGDGLTDLAVGYADAVVLFLSNHGAPQVVERTVLPAGTSNYASTWFEGVAAGDFDGDGFDEVAVLDPWLYDETGHSRLTVVFP